MAQFLESLVEIWEITEYRRGAVYKTRYLRDEWKPIHTPIGQIPGTNLMVVSANQETCKRNGVFMPMRSKKD